MKPLIFLDSGPLGLISNPKSSPRAEACRQWAIDRIASGTRIFVPEIADYEVRRELIRIGATAGLRRLDQVKAQFEYAPITTAVMLEAARLWADARRGGRPTASPDALDGDCILAATAMLAEGTGDVAIIATDNTAHLSLFLMADSWESL